MPTPHNSAEQGAFAKTVLMPGDPLRAKFIAETFLEQPRLVNNVRGIQGYTGRYRGTPVSVMASGMGIPSISLYSHELFHVYNVDNILRIGSAGALVPGLKLRDIVAGQGACTDSAFASQYGLRGSFAPIADFTLLETAVAAAREKGIELQVGNLFTSDVFYDLSQMGLKYGKMGCLAVEMEAAGLYCSAAQAGKRALALCTVSDHLITGEQLAAAERQSSFVEMMEIALETAVRMANRA